MKRFVAMLLMLGMLIPSAIASASDAAVAFEFWAQCTEASNTALNYDIRNRVSKKTEDNNSVYVKHWVYDGSEEYTNFFRAYLSGVYSSYLGQKWATVGLNVPIQSSSFALGSYYGVAGRGNTNHYDYDGNYQVSLHGWVDGGI